MSQPTVALTLQFLEWISSDPRSHAEVIDTWRSSCPRLSIWEDAVVDGLVRYDAASRTVEPTPSGRKMLADSAAADAPLKQTAA